MRVRKQLPPEQRLALAADFKPGEWGGRRGVREKVTNLAKSLKGSGVTFKVNTVLRATGYDLLEEIADQGLVPWADLKLSDTGDTSLSDIEFLTECKVTKLLVTVKCDGGPTTLSRLVGMLPSHIELIGITVLSDMTEEDCRQVFGNQIHVAVDKFMFMAAQCGLGGIVCSGRDADRLNHDGFGTPDNFTVNTPNIRPAWAEVKKDGQNKNRAATIAEALAATADRVVIGRPITQSTDPLGAVHRCMDEINQFYASLRTA